MKDSIIRTTVKLDGGAEYQTEIRRICADLKSLKKCVTATNKRVAQLNKSLKELTKLRNEGV